MPKCDGISQRGAFIDRNAREREREREREKERIETEDALTLGTAVRRKGSEVVSLTILFRRHVKAAFFRLFGVELKRASNKACFRTNLRYLLRAKMQIESTRKRERERERERERGRAVDSVIRT